MIRKKTGKVAFLATLILPLAGCSASAGLKPSQATCNSFLQKMQAHQYPAAYGLLAPACKAVTSQKQLKNYWELVEKNRGAVKSWTQQGTQFYAGTGGSSVQLSYALQSTGGTSGATFKCVPQGNAWLILGFNFTG